MKDRQAIRIGPNLARTLDAGHCKAPSIAKRLDILAARYDTLLASITPPSWPIQHWITYLSLARTCDLAHPAAHFAILGAAKTTAKQFAFTLESLTLPQHVLLISIAERLATTSLDPDTLTHALTGFGIQVIHTPAG